MPGVGHLPLHGQSPKWMFFSFGDQLKNLLIGASTPTQKPSVGFFLSTSLRSVPGVGVEPTSLSRHDFKSCAYTNSATRAYLESWNINLESRMRPGGESNSRIEILQISELPLFYQAIIYINNTFFSKSLFVVPILENIHGIELQTLS